MHELNQKHLSSEGIKGADGNNSTFDNKMNKHLISLILDKFKSNKQAQNIINQPTVDFIRLLD